MKYPNGLELGFIYLAGADGAYKIGKSADPTERVSGFLTANPKIKMVDYWYVIQKTQAERLLHVFFESRGRHADREWFNLEPQDVEWLSDLDDAGMNSWLLTGCRNPFLSDGSVSIYMAHCYNPNSGEVRRVFRQWFSPDLKALLELSFSKKPGPDAIKTLWENHPREALNRAVIRHEVTVCGHSCALLSRPVGPWMETREIDAQFVAAGRLHSPLPAPLSMMTPADLIPI